MESNTSYQKQPVSTLTRENHSLWFRLMRRYLDSKEIGWVLEVSDILGTPASTPEAGSSTSQDPTLSSLEYSIHSPKFRKDNSAALYWIGIYLSEEDEEFVSEYEKARDIWRALETKYKKKLRATAR